MSIRLWLALADCFRCGTSVELTEEQEEYARRLLDDWQKRQAAEIEGASRIRSTMRRGPAGNGSAPVAAPQPAPAPHVPERRLRKRRESPWSDPVEESPPVSRADVLRHVLHPARWRSLGEAILTDLPAWLISLIVHLIFILLLGLLNIAYEPPPPSITLSTSINYRDTPGEEGLLEERLAEPFEFEDAGDFEPMDLVEEFAPGAAEVNLSGISDIIPQVPDDTEMALDVPEPSQEPAQIGYMFAGRDPRVRSRLLNEQGGTNATEAAVARGLRWLARHQNADGSWSLDKFHMAPGASGSETGQGQKSDTAGTALALMAFLGAGQTHAQGDYRFVVLRGLNWLVTHQGKDGDLRGEGIGDMYAHGQATIVLCEAYALTGDKQLREPAQKAVDFIIKAQHKNGGWRYNPGQAGDTSVLGWQLMALRSARMAYLRVPDSVFEGAARFLDSAQTDKYGGRYSYLPGSSPTMTMTAEGLLCRQYLGWPRDHRGLKVGVYYLLSNHMPPAEFDRSEPWFYYMYYASQVMHHMGGDVWKRWNPAMQRLLLSTQRTDGPDAGSWDPIERFGNQGGRIYSTALAVCTLEVYYRHMPLYDSSPAIYLRDALDEDTAE
ncbi:prenyltransferase/squalene oxidase repeat-containing protein [Thermostilla marina]